MSLLLDDDEVFVPPTKTLKVEAQVLDCDKSNDGELSQEVSMVQRTEKAAAATPACSITAQSSPTPSHQTTDAAAVAFPRIGGNGLAKMDALMFGKPKVSVVSQCSSHHTPSLPSTTTRQQTRLSTGSAETGISPVAAGMSSAKAATQQNTTPTTQKTRPAALQLDSEARSTPSGNNSSSTQPKVVSGARSPTSLSSLSQRQVSVVSLDDSLLASQDLVVVEPNPSLSSPKPVSMTSPSASPPARPPVKPSALTATNPASTPATSSADATPTQPAKTQMKLSDFFSKMACKR